MNFSENVKYVKKLLDTKLSVERIIRFVLKFQNFIDKIKTQELIRQHLKLKKEIKYKILESVEFIILLFIISLKMKPTPKIFP